MTNQVTTRASLVPTTLSEAMQFSQEISKSALVPKDYQGKPSNTLVAIQWGMELGLAPMQALQNIAVINGKPSIYGDALLAMVRADSRCGSVREYLEGDEDNRTAVCVITRLHKDDEVEEIERKFSINDAKRAGLWGKQGPWKQYPQRMLQMRARSWAIRDGFPDVIKGLITVEEAQDMPPMKTVKEAQPEPTGPTLAERARAELDKELAALPDTGESLDWRLERIRELKSPPPPSEPDTQYVLHIPGKPSESFNERLHYAQAFNDLLTKVRRADAISHADRRTKMKELEQANSDTLQMLDDELSQELHEKRLSYNASLGAEEKEQADG